MGLLSPSSDFDSESPWDLPFYKVENKLRSERFGRPRINLKMPKNETKNLNFILFRNAASRGNALQEKQLRTEQKKVLDDWYNLKPVRNNNPSSSNANYIGLVR